MRFSFAIIARSFSNSSLPVSSYLALSYLAPASFQAHISARFPVCVSLICPRGIAPRKELDP